MKLAKFDKDWADEFSMSGHELFTDAEWNEFVTNVEAHKYPRELYFGTNEYYDFESAQDFYEAIEIQEISQADGETLQRLGLARSGYFPSRLGEIDDDEISDEDEEERLQHSEG